MKKRILVLAVVVMLVAIAASGTLAYYTANGTARNVITAGSIGIDVVEWTVDEKGSLVPFPEEGLTGIMPGSTASKIVKVENTGNNEAWIRVKVDPSITGADGKTLPATLKDGTSVMGFTVNKGWTLKDGYYYYSEPVSSGKLTEALFSEITFAPGMGNEYQSCVANITIIAQAVQTANNGETVLEAKGWPNT